MLITGQKFELGEVVCSKDAGEMVAASSTFSKTVMECLKRHATGDWGDLSERDKQENEYALDKRLRLFSSYNYSGKDKLWIITEADRHSTCILFPDEY